MAQCTDAFFLKFDVIFIACNTFLLKHVYVYINLAHLLATCKFPDWITIKTPKQITRIARACVYPGSMWGSETIDF